MAQFPRLVVLQKMLDAGIIPVFYHQDVETAKSVIEACARAGALVVEFTHRADFAQETFSALVKHFRLSHPEVVLGVGSIVEEATAAHYINCGANFVVSPVMNPNLARLCNRRKIAYSPGCGSVTEISWAEEFGVEICKIFPGSEVGGPGFIQSVLGPMPWSRLMPTGGVENSLPSISAWIRAGAACLGMGSKLVSSELMSKGDFLQIETNIRQAKDFLTQARSDLKKRG